MPEPASLADENPIAKAYRVWSSTCPFTSRKTMIIIMVATILTIFPYDVRMALTNSVYYTVYNYEVYRLVTSVFSGAGIISLIFGLMSFNQVGPRLERSLGSAGLMALMFTLTVCGNLLFISVCYLLKVAGNSRIMFETSGGIWSLVISLLAVECMATPEQPRRFWLIPVDIPSKFYPLALALIFGLMRASFLDLLCAAAAGYAFATGRMDFLKPSRSRVAGWESGCLSNFVNSSGYIVNGAAEGQETFAIPLNNPEDHPSNRRGDGGESGGFSLFRRGRGNEDGQGGAAGGGGGGGGMKRESFGGSGQALGSGRGGGGRPSMPHVDRGHSQQHDPETARRARLAALEGRGVGGDGERGGGDAEAAAPLLQPSSDGMRALQEMGFSAEAARDALQRNNGDVEAAVAYLSV